MVKTTVGKIMASIPVVADIMGARGKKLPVRVSRRFGVFIAPAVDGVATYHRETANEIIKAYNNEVEIPDAKDATKMVKTFSVPTDKLPEFHAEIAKLDSEERELAVDPINIDDLAALELSPREAAAIDFLIRPE